MTTNAPVGRPLEHPCRHCGLPVLGGDDFCCRGCGAASRLIHGEGLEDFYELRGGASSSPPQVASFERASERAWLEQLSTDVRSASEHTSISVGVAGLYCAACVWLIERSLGNKPGVASVVLNPVRGLADLVVDRDFDIQAAAAELATLGYRLVPPESRGSATDDSLLVRTGIAIALAINSMMLAAAIYLGLSDGFLHQLFVGLGAVMAAGSTWVGGSYFGRRALAVLRERGVSLDVPIAAGIALVFASSMWAALSGRSGAIYFDTLSVFVALMLAGRFLQERLLRRNRLQIASTERVLELGARIIVEGRPQACQAADLGLGDCVLVAPGEVAPADIVLIDDRAGCSLDWMTGESEPRLFRMGEEIPAGSINASKSAFRGEVVRPLARTQLPQLLRTPVAASIESATATTRRVATIYLASVLAAAAVGFGLWLALSGEVPRALEVAAAILVVTCPCALGIGAPLAFELVAGRLANQGAFIRTSDAFTKLAEVRRIAFDKTGTVTEPGLILADSREFDALSSLERHVLYNLASRSSHPHSTVIAESLDGRFDPMISVTEEPGRGVRADFGRCHYRLGQAKWALESATSRPTPSGTVYVVSGQVRARPILRERLRVDAAAELAELTANGYQLALISGDRAHQVSSIANTLGIDAENVVAEASPGAKAKWVEEHDHGDLLFVGDGLNDAQALESASAGATPSIQTPLIAGRVDLVFRGRGLRPIRLALEAAKLLKRVHRAQLGFVVVYNLAAVAVAMAGLMQPWLAALLMPASSLLVTTSTALAVRNGLSWKSSSS